MNEAYIDRYVNTDEPVLFETNAPMLDKHIEDFNRFAYAKRNKAMQIINIILTVILGIQAIILLILGDFIWAFICVAMTVFMAITPKRIIRKAVASSTNNAYHNGNINNYKFYQNCLVNKDNFTISAIPYEIIVDAYETDEYFFLFISKVQAHIIPKNSFVYNSPAEMRKLLTMKLGSRFIVHCSQ